MSYPDPGFREDARYRGETGFREEPDFRPDPAPSGAYPAFQPGRFPSDETPTAADATTVGMGRRAVTAAELDDAFDDPSHGEPGMDRMGVHVLVEVVLLLAVVVVGFLFRRWHAAGITGDGLHSILIDAASLGAIATGLALSLRAGVVNLAVGPVAAASGLFFAGHLDRGLFATTGVTVLLAGAVGLAIGLLVAVFHVPGWAASLGAVFAVLVWIQKHTDSVPVHASYQPQKHAIYWFAGFAAISVLGGVLGLFKGVRRGLGRFRPVGDPAARRGAGAAVVAICAVVGSTIFAALGGALSALGSDQVEPVDGLVLTGLVLGAVLVGGASVYGRRGGIFGTLLAVTLLVLLLHYGDAADWKMSPYAVAAGAIAIGLGVSRMVEAYGRPRSTDGDDDLDTWGNVGRDELDEKPGGGVWGGGTPRQTGWGSQLPARSIDDTWGGASDDRWGSR